MAAFRAITIDPPASILDAGRRIESANDPSWDAHRVHFPHPGIGEGERGAGDGRLTRRENRAKVAHALEIPKKL